MSAGRSYKMLLQQLLVYCLAAQVFTVAADITELKAFEDFLHLNHLPHGIVVLESSNAHSNFRPKDLRFLSENQRIRFFNVGAKPNFSSYFYASSPRVGIFVSPLESIAVQQQVLATASAASLFNNSQAWFVLATDCTNFHANAKRVFGHLKINIDADITAGFRTANNSLKLYDLYKVSSTRDFPLEIEEKGAWSTATGFQLMPQFREGFVRRRRNFWNLTMPAGSAITEKPANLKDLEHLTNTRDNKQLDSMQRKTYNLLKMLEPMLNVSFEIVFSDAWGQHVAGNWTGVVGNLLEGKVEFAICPMRFTLERLYLIQYTPELHTEVIRFLLRHPRRNVIRNIFFEPLTDEVWWTVLALTVLTTLLLTLHVKHEYNQRQQQQQQQQHADTPRLERRFDAVVLIILEAILMQGPAPSLFNLPSTRVLILTLCAFSVMLLQFYAAFIVGSLLALVPRSITTLPALYNSSLEIGMEDVAYNYDIFNSTNKVANDFYTQRIAARNPSARILTLERGAERIGRGGFAFYVAVDRAYRILKYLLTESEFCDLQEIALQPPISTASALRKNSAYREYFATSILHFRATGLLQYNDKMWAVQKTDCSLKRNTEVEVDMEHFVPALVLLAVAMLISGLVLAVELATNWWCRRSRSSEQQQLRRQKQQQLTHRNIANIRKLQQRENF